MTDVEHPSTARLGRSRRLRATGLAWTAVIAIAGALVSVVPSSGAGADQLSDARARAAQIESELQAQGQRVEILGQQYDAAEQQVQALGQRLKQNEAQISTTKRRVAAAQRNLRQQAVSAYMMGSSGTELDSMFTGGGLKASAAQEYSSVAAGNLSGAIDAYHSLQTTLTNQQNRLQSTEARARSAANQVASAQQQAEAVQAEQQSTLSQVKGQIATLVQQQQAAAAEAAAAEFRAKVNAEQQAQAQAAARQQAATSTSGTTSSGGGSSGGGGGGTSGGGGGGTSGDGVPVAPGAAGAVAAAESQLGVPYVWGGESPGVGFDCSGLTQWAWGRAGVGLPRTAAAQYDAIPHVSLDALQPGDLLFWNDGTSSIQHVAMYVGGGEIIQAPYTGSVVSYAPIYTSGLVGAGRP